MKTKLIMLATIAASILSACKGDEGPQGPQGNAGTNGAAFSLAQGGSIQGTISGFRSDGITTFNLPFDFKFYYDQDNFWYDQFSSLYRFRLYRYPAGNPSVPGICSISVLTTSLSATMPTDFDLWGDFYQDLGNNQKFNFYLQGLNNSFYIINNFSYNATSRTCSGSFSINVDAFDNSTGYPATITGTFQSNPMVEYVFRKE